MKHSHKNRIACMWFGITIAIVAVSLAIINVDRSSSQTTNDSCSGLYLNVSPIETGSSSTLSVLADVNVYKSSNALEIEKVTIFASKEGEIGASKKLIGRARAVSLYMWNFKWATALWPNGQVKLSAEVFYKGFVNPCSINSNYILNVINAQTVTLNVESTPAEWTGPINSASQIFIVKSFLASLTFDPTPYSIFEWSKATDVGNISTLDDRAYFSSGLKPGSNIISVRVIYGGSEKVIGIPINVESIQTIETNNDTTSSAPTDANTSQADIEPSTVQPSSTPTVADTTTSKQITSSQVQNNLVTKSCIEEVFSVERYVAVNGGTSRPTAEELERAIGCFAPSKYILPLNFSPIDPLATKELTVDEATTINKLENIAITDGSSDKPTLKISGKAKPNSVIIIYIYSDPIIITTSSDSDGNWQYTLEDPLEPGDHEVYAIVDKGDGAYKRSEPLAFFISTASATAANPNGLSLELSDSPTETPSQSNRSLIIYVVGSVVILGVAVSGLYIILRLRNKRRKNIMPMDDVSVPGKESVLNVAPSDNVGSDSEKTDLSIDNSIQSDNIDSNKVD